jgi:ubiquinone/menaquinone biosynthesis C-methylase UbiE/uncharacterized protein YbaR (Trm112 family)
LLPSLLELVCCPRDGGFPLTLQDPTCDGPEVVSGSLLCPLCGDRYHVTDGIPHLLPADGSTAAGAAASKQREAVARDSDAPAYDANYPEYQTRVEVQALMDAVDIRPGELVLDLGAGTGRITGPLLRCGATVLATDLSPRSLELNRERWQPPGGTVHYVVMDVCQMPLRDEIVASAISGGMLQSIEGDAERRRFAREAHRVLRPGGRLALTTFNFSWSFRRRGTRDGFYGDDLYYYRMRRGELRELFRRFRLRRLTGLVNVPPDAPQSLERLIQEIPALAGHTGDFLLLVAERTA